MNVRVLAAGGVLWRTATTGEVEVAGVYRPSARNWSLPKGKLHNGEHLLTAACREVTEETGLNAIPQKYLTSARYQLSRPGGDVTKSVDFWSMRTDEPFAAFVTTTEVTQQRWFSLGEATRELNRPRDQEALRVFAAMPMITSTVILARHAHAESTAADGDDFARRIDDTGWTQAKGLAALLRLYAPQRIVAATPKRCASTAAPLAETLDIKTETDQIFDADTHYSNAERASIRVRELATAGASVVFTQAPVIADVLAILADTDGVGVSSVHTPPAGAWVLSFSHSRLVAVERMH